MIKNFNINKNSTQSGRSMIEMLGVLAIVGVLSVGGIAGYSKAMEKFKINKTIDQVSTIVANVRTLFAQQTSYGNMWTYEFKETGVVPDDIEFEISYYFNPFGGFLHVVSGNSVGLSEKNFAVLLGGLPKDVCIALASYDWGDLHSTGLAGITIGDNTYDVITYSNNYSTNSCALNNNKLYCLGTGKIPLTQAQQACSAIGNGAWFNLVYE
jgi:type II secretory pathway pseudopilin PulG